MPALSEHLRDPEGHSRLAFHPRCPICRGERLSGRLPMETVVSRRARAALTAGVVTVATVAPAAAMGAEPTTTRASGAPAAGPAGVDSALSADLVPGGNVSATGTAADTRADDTTDDDDVAGDFASDQGEAPDGTALVAGGGAGTQNGGDQAGAAPAPPAGPTPTPAVPVAPPAAPAADAASSAVIHPPPEPEPEPVSTPASTMVASAAASGRPVLTLRSHVPKRTTKAHAIATSRPVAAADAPAPAPPLPAPADAADTGDRAHTVHAGESLWSIASDRLGPGAGPAQIAREVHRLWQLNADRIGTGDPDLLMVGTRLRLR